MLDTAERLDQQRSSLRRYDDVIDPEPFGSKIGIDLPTETSDQFGPVSRRIGSGLNLASIRSL